MKCYICDASNWHETGLHTQSNLAICKECGSVAHISDKPETEYNRFYRDEYRQAPNTMNLITTTHKLNQIKLFINEWLKGIGTRKMKTVDIGCSTGYFVHWLKQQGHDAYGTEFALTHRRFAGSFYKLMITEQIQTKHRYDFMSLYHVLEHVQQPDVKLKEWTDLMAGGGTWLISCPEWFDMLEESSGLPMNGFEHLFHKNHLNVFSNQSLKNLFTKTGLVITKEDHLSYGQTYLLTRNVQKAPANIEQIVREDWNAVLDNMKKIKSAIELYQAKKYEDAIAMWPRFPEAWGNLIFDKYMKVPDKQAELLIDAGKVLGDSFRFRYQMAVYYYKMEQPEQAMEHLNWLMNVRPSEDILMMIGWCLALMGRHRDAIGAFYRAGEMNPRKWNDAMDWVCREASSIPTFDEIAEQKIRETLFQQAGGTAMVSDPEKAKAIINSTATSITPAVPLAIHDDHRLDGMK